MGRAACGMRGRTGLAPARQGDGGLLSFAVGRKLKGGTPAQGGVRRQVIDWLEANHDLIFLVTARPQRQGCGLMSRGTHGARFSEPCRRLRPSCGTIPVAAFRTIFSFLLGTLRSHPMFCGGPSRWLFRGDLFSSHDSSDSRKAGNGPHGPRMTHDKKDQADHDLDADALTALDQARKLKPGPERAEAMKRAGILRRAADLRGLFFPKRGRPRKM